MIRIRPPRLVLALLLTGALPASAQSEDVSEYLPMAKGAEWHYAINKTATYGSGEDTQEDSSTGSSFETVTGVGDHPLGALYVLRQDVAETDALSGRTTRGTFETVVTSEPGQILMHAQRTTGSGIPGGETHFDPPVAMLKLPLPKEGEPNPALLKEAGVVIDARAFAVDHETVKTDAGEFADCLKISSKGPISGELQQGARTMPIAEGTIELTSWYGSGVGLVKQVQTRYLKVELGDGKTAESRETHTKSLTKFSLP